jgi:hypothetical protein
MSGARRGAGERSRALTGGTSLSAGVGGGEAAASGGRVWPAREGEGGPSLDE